jgi:hypothetical protein
MSFTAAIGCPKSARSTPITASPQPNDPILSPSNALNDRPATNNSTHNQPPASHRDARTPSETRK